MPTSTAPIEIGHVALTVNDTDRVSGFYQNLLGFDVLENAGAVQRLGVGDRVFLELRADRAATRNTGRDAGLFHTAFLMPDRPALARWLIHAADAGAPFQGASDHLVSEAIYLADPEGNGIEVYVDRPRSDWSFDGPNIRMATKALDLNALAQDADAPWSGAPEDMTIGHVHLQVGDVGEAEAFYSGVLGFDITTHYPGAAFFASGGYHHHLAANIWNSRGAGLRPDGMTGLAELELRASPAELAAIREKAGGDQLSDPWGTAIRVTAKAD